jgi:dihydropteroate synthase
MHLACRDHVVDLAVPVVMGVLNVTPDSFSDGGRFVAVDAAVEHGLRMVEEGAGIVDVGGESTRPGATPVTADDELARVVPVIERLARHARVPISVDSSKPEVIRAAIAAGASIVNDVRSLQLQGALAAAADSGVAVCLMHMQGDPGSMQQTPHYDDVVAEVGDFLAGRVADCEAAGIARERICVDPGIGFGKRPEHNLALLVGLDRLAPAGLPVLVGVSRKSLVGFITGRPAPERLAGSVAFAALCVERGAAIVRAHDVAATVDAVKVAVALRRAAEKGG